MIGLGPPWSEAGGRRSLPPPGAPTDRFARRSSALRPNSEGVGALIDAVVAGLPRPDPRAVARLADAVGGRAGDEAYRAFHRELYGWLATYARDVEPGSAQGGRDRELWDRIRDAERETEALNLDRKLHVLALSPRSPRPRPDGAEGA